MSLQSRHQRHTKKLLDYVQKLQHQHILRRKSNRNKQRRKQYKQRERSEDSKLFNLPEEPVDGYTVEWWVVDGYFAKVYKETAVYHINTPWEGSVPLVACWMLSGFYCCRILGWENIEFGGADIQRRFRTYEEARSEAIRRLTNSIRRLKEDLEEAEETFRVIAADGGRAVSG